MLWPSSTYRRSVLGIILLVAAGIRLLLWALVPHHQPANDEVEYLAVAHDLLAGQGWRFYDAYPWLRAPLYPLWLAASLWLAGGDPQLALLPNILLGVIQVWLIWMLGYALAGRRERAEQAGLWAAAAGAVLLTMATFANLWMSEVLWSTLWTLFLLLMLRWRSQPRLSLALAAGVVLGLTILTRSVPLLWTPFLLGWMIWIARRQSIPHLAALVIMCGLVIAPWTLRNWRAYSAPILVETGFSYNLWAFSEPTLELEQINAILSDIADPVERADYASAQGMQLLRDDPTIVPRKIWPNTVYLWRIKPIEDRFLQRSYYSDVPLGYFIAGLVLDDLLYVVLLCAAVWGLAHAQRDARFALMLLWLGYIIGTTALTHGEARYRHFFWPILLAYAGATFAKAGVAAPGWQRVSFAGVGAIILLVLGTHYPWAWATDGVQRGWYRLQALRYTANNELGLAEQAALAGISTAASPDSWIRLGQIYKQQGNLPQAEWALTTAVNSSTSYPRAAVALGTFWLEHGTPEQARDAWDPPYVAPEIMLEWAWREQLRPTTSTIDLGGGLDLGLIQGFYPAEIDTTTSIRWSSDVAYIRLPAGQAEAIHLRLRDPRPAEAPANTTTICTTTCLSIQPSSEWRTIHMLLPASTTERIITLNSVPWQPSMVGLGPDERKLGLMIDSIQLEPDQLIK